MKGLISRIRPFARDILILVVGIMLSFLLNEYRQKLTARGEEQRIMQQLTTDLEWDLEVLVTNAEGVEELLEITDYFMRSDAADPDSLAKSSIVVELLASYIPFLPERTALLELSYQNQRSNLKNTELVSKVIGLHERTYVVLDEVTDVHRDYIMNNLVLYYQDNLPATRPAGATAAELEQLRQVFLSDAFLNRVSWVETLLDNINDLYDYAIDEVEAILSEVKSTHK